MKRFSLVIQGRAHGVVNVLRGIGHHALHDRCYIPSQLLLECGYSVEQLLRDCRDVLGGRSTSLPINVREVTFRLASVASLHLQKADSILTNNQLTSKRTAQIFLPVHVLQRYLKQLQRIDFDVLHSTLRTRDGLLPMYLWWKTSRWSDG